MSDPCPHCGGPHPFHDVVRARSARRWRGRNFDAAAAEGAVGAAVLAALGLSAARAEDFRRFAAEAVVAAVRPPLDENPATRFDPAEGEAWEFHVALRRPLEPAAAERLRAAVREAVAGARNFALA